ncbi:MAG: DUF2730 domain-containing protein [Notoacmeibacter sp.]|nr:DUF2730 domain-containing protein [Notoacmeibacter sp.]
MDLAAIIPWVTAALAVIALLGHAKTFFGSGAKENATAISSLKTTVVAHDRRIQSVEQELRHLPSKDDVNDLKLSLSDVKGSIGRLDESVTGVNRAVRRVEDYLNKKETT